MYTCEPCEEYEIFTDDFLAVVAKNAKERLLMTAMETLTARPATTRTTTTNLVTTIWMIMSASLALEKSKLLTLQFATPALPISTSTQTVKSV